MLYQSLNHLNRTGTPIGLKMPNQYLRKYKIYIYAVICFPPHVMENYQIYDEIGKGKFSSVYKARHKKSIQYVAVKSTQKNRMAKVEY